MRRTFQPGMFVRIAVRFADESPRYGLIIALEEKPWGPALVLTSHDLRLEKYTFFALREASEGFVNEARLDPAA